MLVLLAMERDRKLSEHDAEGLDCRSFTEGFLVPRLLPATLAIFLDLDGRRMTEDGNEESDEGVGGVYVAGWISGCEGSA